MNTIVKLTKCFILMISFVVIINSQDKQVRNLSDYIAGDKFVTFVFASRDEGERQKSRVTLWDFWTQKKLAYFKVNYITREGRNTLCTYYIEKNKTGQWQVVIECDRFNVCPYVQKKDCEKFRYTKITYSGVEKIDLPDNKFKILLHDAKTKKVKEF